MYVSCHIVNYNWPSSHHSSPSTYYSSFRWSSAICPSCSTSEASLWPCSPTSSSTSRRRPRTSPKSLVSYVSFSQITLSKEIKRRQNSCNSVGRLHWKVYVFVRSVITCVWYCMITDLFDLDVSTLVNTVETQYNEILGTKKICSLYQIFSYISS